MGGAISDVQRVISYVREYTKLTPVALTVGTNTTLIQGVANRRNVPVELGFQNRDTVARTVSLRENDTEFMNLELAAGTVVTVTWTDALEQRLAVGAALRVVPSANGVVWLTHGRYYAE